MIATGGMVPAHEPDELEAEVERLRAEAATKLDACQREIARLRAYLPLARAAECICEGGANVPIPCDICVAYRALTPEQRAWLMEDK